MTTTTSLLQTALQNLHISQQAQQQSLTPRAPSSQGSPRMLPVIDVESDPTTPPSEDDDEIVRVGQGTRPGTPLIGQRGLVLGERVSQLGGGRNKDPLDIRSLARCDRVCKRWCKSSTLNYVWYLQNRALILPSITVHGQGKLRKTTEDTEFFDPYDKSPRLATLPVPPFPSSPEPQWSKLESRKAYKNLFRQTLKRSDPNVEEEVDPLRVDISSLHTSGANTPNRHSHAGAGSGGAVKWQVAGTEGVQTPSERKLAAREGYKAMGGRKAKSKRKMGGDLGARDKGGATDDGRFDAPW